MVAPRALLAPHKHTQLDQLAANWPFRSGKPRFHAGLAISGFKDDFCGWQSNQLMAHFPPPGMFSTALLLELLLPLVSPRHPEDCCRLVILRSTSTSRYAASVSTPIISTIIITIPSSPEASRRTFWACTGGRGGSTSVRCTGAAPAPPCLATPPPHPPVP